MASTKNPDSVMSAEDQARIEYYRELYNNATDKATKDAAHKAAEDVRQKYGYSGGTDGTQYITEGVEKAAGDYYDASLSDSEQRAVDNARVDYYVAQYNDDKAGMDAAHAAAESVRANSTNGGYSGGTDGSEYIPITTTPSYSYYTPQITLPDMPNFEDLKVPEFTAMEIPTAPDVEINDFSQYIEEMTDEQTKAALAGYEEAYQKNTNAIDRAGVGVDEAFRSARNQTAGASELAKRNFAQYAAGSGLNSGVGGQAELARNVTLQNNMNTLNTQEAQSLADLQKQYADNETWYNSTIAAAQAEGNTQKAQLLYQEKIRVESETIAAIQQKFANQVTTAQMQMDAAQQQFADEVTKKQMQYQALRDSVSDTKWLAEFDFQYQQWLQAVDAQQQQMEFQRDQWEQSVNAQNAQLTMQKQSLDAELEQMQISNDQWQQTFDANNAQWQQEFNAKMGTIADNTNGVSGITGTGTSYNNGTLSSSQIREMQEYYGLSADGYWGPNSQSVTGMSAEDAWKKYQEEAGVVVTYPTNTNFGSGTGYANVNAGVASSGMTRDEYDTAVRGGNTDGYTALLNELSRIEDSGRNVATKAAIAIQEALEDGKISQAVANRLFAQYGL